MQVKNVIIVNDYDYVQGGASAVAIEMANSFQRLGYNVTFFCGVSNKEKSALLEGVKVVSVDKYDSINNPNKIKGALKGIYNSRANKLMKLSLENCYSDDTVVFIHGWTKALSPSFLKFINKKKIKTVLTGHDYFSVCPNGGIYNYQKNKICDKCGKKSCAFTNCDSRNYFYKIYRMFRFFYQNRILKFRKKIDYLITISDFSENILKKYFNSKIVRIYNPTSIEEKKDRVEVELNDSYIYVGRLSAEKGVDKICETFQKIDDKIVIVGDGEQYRELKERYVRSNITFTGWQSRENVMELMRKSKGLILSSLWYEGAPLVIFEALSQGIPCIVSNLCAATDFVNEENGWQFNPLNENELLGILKNVNNNELKIKSLVSYGNYWKKPYSKERYMEELNELISTL